MNEHLQAIATLFSLINPGVCALIFSQVAAGQSASAAFRDATKAMLTTCVILIAAAFLGAPILSAFGVSLDAFSVAGGMVLAFIGFTMLRGISSSSTPQDLADPHAHENSLKKLVLFAASPGTIAGVITIATAHSGSGIPFTAIVAIVVVLAVTWALLITADRFAGAHKGGPTLAQDMLTRYMGLIVIAMGIQYAMTGIAAFIS